MLPIDDLPFREYKTQRHIRIMLSLAFVTLDLVEAAIARTMPRRFSMSRFADTPMAWNEESNRITFARIAQRKK